MPVVCTENLNPDVVVMESRGYSGPLDGARDRRISIQ
jgi:hypothetical protein